MRSSEVQKKRKIYIDFLKIIAIYMVLFNHTHEDGFLLFTIARTSKLYMLYMFNAVLIKIAVPLFFMASGALLLGKEESYRDLLVKRFLKYVIVLTAGSAVVYLYTCLRLEPQEMSIGQFLKKLYTTNMITAYWYLYVYLAYILMLPLLRKMAKNMTDADYKWMFLMFGIMQSLSIIDFLLFKGAAGHNGFFSFFITVNYVFYPLAGYYIDQKPEKVFTRKKCLVLVAASITSIIVSCLMTQYKCTMFDEWAEGICDTFFETFIFLPAFTVFYCIKMWFINIEPSNKACRVIAVLGGTIFGIYLIEQICRLETRQIFIWLRPYIHTLPACWIWILLACMFGAVITLILKQIPVVKKFI